MSEVVPVTSPLPIPVGVRWLHVLCRLGRFLVPDSADPDAHPDAIPVVGKIRVRLQPARIIWQESDGRWRSLDSSEMAYDFRADGELVDNEGRTGLNVPDPMSEGVEPRGYTMTFTVMPEGGSTWTVTVGGLLQLPAEIDLVRMSSVAPATGVSNVEARLAALEALSGQDGLRFPTAITVADPASPRDATIHWSDGSTSGLLLPEGAPGHTPVITWDGTRLVIDGTPGPDLLGPPGPPTSLSIGTVDTLAAGAAATAEVTGDAPDQTLHLGIPQGAKGDTGPPNRLTIGTVGQGQAAASITGTAPSQTLNLVLPQGAKGDTGPSGGPIPAGGTPGQVPTPLEGGGYGWVPMSADEVAAGPFTRGAATTLGSLTLTRLGKTRTLTASGIRAGGTSAVLGTVDAADRPPATTLASGFLTDASAANAWGVTVGADGVVTLTATPAAATDLSGTVEWRTA